MLENDGTTFLQYMGNQCHSVTTQNTCTIKMTVKVPELTPIATVTRTHLQSSVLSQITPPNLSIIRIVLSLHLHPVSKVSVPFSPLSTLLYASVSTPGVSCPTHLILVESVTLISLSEGHKT